MYASRRMLMLQRPRGCSSLLAHSLLQKSGCPHWLQASDGRHPAFLVRCDKEPAAEGNGKEKQKQKHKG